MMPFGKEDLLKRESESYEKEVEYFQGRKNCLDVFVMTFDIDQIPAEIG